MTMEIQAKPTAAVRNGKISVQILSPHVEKIPPSPTPTKPTPSSEIASISSRIKRLMQRKKAPVDAPTSDTEPQKQKRPKKIMIIGSEAANGVTKPATDHSEASSSNSEDNIKPHQYKDSSEGASTSTSSASTPAWSFVSAPTIEPPPPPKAASSRIGILFDKMLSRKRASIPPQPERSPIEYVLFDDEGRPAWTMRRTTKETEADLPEELEDVDCVRLE